MDPLKRFAIAVTLLLGTAGPSLAATPSDFYLDLLKKGVAEFNAARYDGAVHILRVAAFGLLETTENYQIAQIYRAIAADKLNNAALARDAAQRALAAERVQRTYASLALPASVRTSFESVAKKVLAPSEMASLTSGAPVPPAQQPPPQSSSQPNETKPVPQATTSKPPATQQKPAPPRTTTTPPVETKPAPAKAEPPPAAKTETPKVEPVPVKPVPQPVKPEPQPVKPEPKPEPAQTETAPPPRAEPPPKPAPKPVEPTPAPAPVRDVAALLANGERSLNTGNLTEARRVYRQLLDGALTHEQAIRVAEGLYRARDFANVLRAFEKVGALRRGEEPYRFYLAVALYESGRFAQAKKELDAVLDYIEITPDVARYKTKIESAID